MTFVPIFEPEVIAAGARQWRGCTDKVPTTALRLLTHHGVTLFSRYQKADELELMAQILDLIPADLVAAIDSMDCDSNWQSFGVKARCGHQGLGMIGRAISRALLTLSGGHGDLTLRSQAGAEAFVEPQWRQHEI